MKNPPTNLADALLQLHLAKAEEIQANNARLQAEEAVLKLVGTLPPEGTHRFSGGELQAVITTSMRRTVDQAVLANVAPMIPEAIGKRLIRWKPDLDLREARFVENNEPEIWQIVAQAITTKPAKPAIKVEPVKAEREAA